MADNQFYWMGDDFGDGGGDFGDDGGNDDGSFDDQDDQQDDADDGDDQDDDQPDDEDGDDQENGDGDDGDDGDNGNNGDNGDDGNGDGDNGDDDGDDNLDDKFASEEDLPAVDDDVFQSVADFPNADERDFADDTGDWTTDDYQQSAQNLFGDHEFFGDTLTQQKTDEGFQPFQDTGFAQGFDQIAPGTSDSVHLFEREGQLFAFGLVSQAVLEMLAARYTGIDLGGLEVAVPSKGDAAPPQPLPPAFANVAEQPAVDLRKYATPISDQGQTGRCSAFAWTHAVEMSRNILQQDSTRLCPNFTMLEFQRMQGDAKDYPYA